MDERRQVFIQVGGTSPGMDKLWISSLVSCLQADSICHCKRDVKGLLFLTAFLLLFSFYKHKVLTFTLNSITDF